MADYKKILVFVSVFSVLLLATVIALSVVAAQKKTKEVIKNQTVIVIQNETDKICMTKACISAANLILNSMDQTADPCVDFNKFSCGNFIKTRRIPDDASSTDTFSDLRNNLAFAVSDSLEEPISANEIKSTADAKRYYKSCLNDDDLENNGAQYFLNVIKNQLGDSRLVSPNFDVNNEDTFGKLVKFGKSGLKPLFNVYISSNPKNPELYVLRLAQSGWFLIKKDYSNDKVVSAYKNLINSLFELMNPNNPTLKADVDSMFELEKELALNTLDAEQRRNQTFSNITIKELQNRFPGFDWTRYIVTEIYGELPKLQVTENEPILVDDESYLKKVGELYQDASINKKKDLHNLLIWSFVKGRTSYLPKAFRNIQLEFDKIYSGTNSIPSRARTCANAISDRMPFAVGRLYVSKNFDEASKIVASEMIENIRQEFKTMLDANDWMDEASKQSAREKADFIDAKIGYPDYTYNDTYLDELYKNYDFKETNYLENSLIVLRVDSKESYGELREKRDTKDWISGPAIVNAFYSSTNNQICFPAGILQAPFFDSKVPNYLNYGAIGTVIGHEITHGFDDQGRKYDKNGIFFPDGEVGLWTNKTIENYKNKAQCIVDQYSNYVAKQINMNLKGFQTQGENIADNGGIKESFRAYREWAKKNEPEPLLPGLSYNQEQLFFINYAQVWCLKLTDQALEQRILTGVHSPGEFRVIGPTSNIEYFGQVFKCKANQPNNPDKKCSVW